MYEHLELSRFKVVCKILYNLFLIFILFLIQVSCSESIDHTILLNHIDQKEVPKSIPLFWTSDLTPSKNFLLKDKDPWRIYVASSLYQGVEMWSNKIRDTQIVGKKKSHIQIQFAATQTLLHWIRYARSADWLIIADPSYLNDLQVQPNFYWSIPLTCTRLVAVSSSANTFNHTLSFVQWIKNIVSLAVAHPNVPLGKYTETILQHLLKEQVLSMSTLKDKIKVYGNSARQTMHYLQLSEVQGGILYLNNAYTLQNKLNSLIHIDIPLIYQPKVTYHLVALSSRGAHHLSEALSLRKFLNTIQGLSECYIEAD
jgi:ABC-type molybdate transport system substrate-binding protein